jgi:acetyl esterase/lipase
MTSHDHFADAELIEWFMGVLDDSRERFPGEPTTVTYGYDDNHVIDLWGDANAPVVVVSIHGGYFAAEYDRSVNEPVSRRLAHEGFEVANIEYRRAGATSDPMDTVADVRAATAWVVNHAAGRPVLITGHSAGGYLCLAASVVDGVTGQVPLAPVTNLRQCHDGGWDDGEIARWIGRAPSDDPATWDRMELTTVGIGSCPCVIIHGTDDRVVPCSQSEEFVADRPALTLVRLAATGHYEFMEPMSQATDTLIDALNRLVDAPA